MKEKGLTVTEITEFCQVLLHYLGELHLSYAVNYGGVKVRL
jgi:hypothetical protein